jgi:hypothetical protein
MKKKEDMLKESYNILCLFIEITEKKIVIWDAGITVFAVPTLFFGCTTALTLSLTLFILMCYVIQGIRIIQSNTSL